MRCGAPDRAGQGEAPDSRRRPRPRRPTGGGSCPRRRVGARWPAAPRSGSPRGTSPQRERAPRAGGAAGSPSGQGGRPAAATPRRCYPPRPDAGPACAMPQWRRSARRSRRSLRPCPVENTCARADNFAGTSTAGSPSATRRCAIWRPTPWPPPPARGQQFAIPVAGPCPTGRCENFLPYVENLDRR